MYKCDFSSPPQRVISIQFYQNCKHKNYTYSFLSQTFRLCNTHLQQAGYPVAKRDRKGLKKENGVNINDCLSTEKPSNQTSEHNSSIEMSDGDPYALSDDMDNLSKNDSINSEACRKTVHMNSPLTVEPLTPSSTSSSVDSNADSNVSKHLSASSSTFHLSQKNKRNKPDLKMKSPSNPKRKKHFINATMKNIAGIQLPSILQQLEDAIHAQKPNYLLSDEIEDSEQETSENDGNLSQYFSSVLLRRSWITQRSSLCSVEKNDHLNRYSRLAKLIDAEERSRSPHQLSVSTKVIQAARECPDKAGLVLQGRNPLSPPSGVRTSSMKIFTKRRCSFKRVSPGNVEPDVVCSELCLPCSTLCSRHILYSVDQQLFEFCSARSFSGKCIREISYFNLNYFFFERSNAVRSSCVSYSFRITILLDAHSRGRKDGIFYTYGIRRK